MGVPKSWLLSQVSKPHMQGFLALCTARCTVQVHIYIFTLISMKNVHKKCLQYIIFQWKYISAVDVAFVGQNSPVF